MNFVPVLGLTAGLLLAQPDPAQTVDEIVARNFEARGGLATLKAVQSLRITGRMTVGPATEAPMVIEMKRPYRFRLDVTFQGKTLSSAYDGKNGWQYNPFEGSGSAEAMGPEDQSEAAEQADMDGSLVDWKQKGHSVELLGRERVGEVNAWKLRITLKNGTVRTLYLSPETYLAIKSVTRRMVDGAESETEQMIGDYRKVSGILIPHSLEGGPTGSSERQKTIIEKIEVNVPIDDGRFAMPPKKQAPRPENDDSSRQGIGGIAN